MKKNSKIFLTSAATLGIVSLTLTGCGDSSSSDAASGGGDVASITLMLNWYPYGEHAAFYYGVDQGIFEEHGIDLEIEAGQGSTRTAQAVGQGQVDFGWADTPAVMANIDKGVKIKSVGVFLQTTPSAVQVFTDSGISTPEDLAQTTIAVSAGDAPTTTFPAYLAAAGIDESDVATQNLDPAGKVAAMLSEQVDGLIGFAHDQGPSIADESGRDVTYLRYADVGLNFYSNGLIAPNDTIADDPELVDALVQATSEAFAAATADPAAAVAAMEGKDPQMPNGDVLQGQWEETIQLLETDATAGQAPGTNDAGDWESTIEVLSDAGLSANDATIDTYYTDEFQPE